MIDSNLLLAAYRKGIFPMALDQRGHIGWFSPDPRAIIPLDDRFHVPHELRRVWKQNRFEITFDKNFSAVIRQCARRREGTWISPGIVASYCGLHKLGYAHSVEARIRGELVGGLYGVHLGAAFFGESMFHNVSNASKVALVALVRLLRERGFVLLDTQWRTPHLAQFGTVEISRCEYLRILEQAVNFHCTF